MQKFIQIVVFLCFVSVLITAPALGQNAYVDYPKVGPHLLLKLNEARADSILSVVTTWDTAPPPGAGTCVGRVCTKKLSKYSLMKLLKDPLLMSASLPRLYKPRLDVAGVTTGADMAHQKLGLDGSGVLIAIIDTGLDWTHPDFIDDQGKTRLAWLLDLSMPPQGIYPDLELLGRGAVFSAKEIQQVLDTGNGPAIGAGLDTMGHGTHVAGIAAGDDDIYTGVAPGARLLIVKAFDSDSGGFAEDRILHALAFCLEIARREGSALVVNLSLGNQMGAHDGTEALELALQQMTESTDTPCAVTVAAGNEGQLAIHARAALRKDGRPLHLGVFLANTRQATPSRPASVVLDFWWRGSSLDVTVSSPGGWKSDTIGPAESRWESSAWSPDGLVNIAQQKNTSMHNGLHNMTITLTGESGSALSSGLWDIEFTGDATRLDGWIGQWDLGGWPGPRFTNHVDHDETIGPPATARGVIAVGSMISRTSWTSADGKDRNMSEAQEGQLSRFSARGPTTDGRLKPELVAPGQVVASSMSAQADYRMVGSIFYSGGSMRNVMPDGIHALASGTSMASPFAAGLCALAFESFGKNISGKKLHDRLMVSGQSDDLTGTELFDEGWGFGKLQVMNFFETADSPAPLDMDTHKSLCGVSRHWLPLDPQQHVTVSFIPRTTVGQNLGPALQANIQCDECNFTSGTVDNGNGLYTRTMNGVGRRGQILRPICKLASTWVSASPQVVLAATEQEASQGTLRGGGFGCSHLIQHSRIKSDGTGRPIILFFLLWGILRTIRRNIQSN